MAEPAVLFYQESDKRGVLDLLQCVFGGWPRVEVTRSAEAHLDWKLHPPNEVGHIVAHDGSSLIGCVLVIPLRLWFAGRAVDAYHGVDVAVDPAHQDRGIMRAMLEFLVQVLGPSFDLEYGVPSRHPTMRRAATAVGGRRITLPLSVLTCDGTEDNLLMPPPPPGLVLREVSSFDDRIQAFSTAVCSSFDLAALRSKDSLNWRFADTRAGGFTIRLAERAGELLGYSVLRVSRGAGYIADLLALPGHDDVAVALLADGVQLLRERAVSHIEVWLPTGHPYMNVARGHGFAATGRTIDMSFGGLRMNDGEVAALGRPALRTHITAGDTDLI